MTRLLRALRLTAMQLALVGIAGWSAWAQLMYRTPSRYVGVVLATVALVLLALSVVFWLRALGRGTRAKRPWLVPSVLAHRVCALVIAALAFYGLFLFSNATFDIAEPTHYGTEIARIGLDETAIGIRVPLVWADVRSWRRPGELERILVKPDERERLWAGQAVVVSVRPGFHGVPWVSRIEGDVEKRSRAVLALAPDSAQIRKDLAEFYVRLGRFTEAAMATREYARRFPEDLGFPLRIATVLTSRGRFADVVTALDDMAARWDNADAYTLLGDALTMQGRRPEGQALLERARELRHLRPVAAHTPTQ
jgi:tetratricopeptide (TPR) repeat protein